MDILWLILLIPIVACLNHLGGQSTKIPNPRITCRVFGIPAAVTWFASLAGMENGLLSLFLIYLGGMALWAIPHWGQMFMVFNGEDHRDYKRYALLGEVADLWAGVTEFTKLTPTQARDWGQAWGTLRGGFMYPMFLALALYFTPWALAIGLFCFLQGTVYRGSSAVYYAEWKWGGLIGSASAAILGIAIS